MGVQGAKSGIRNLNVEFAWEAYRVKIQEVFSKLPENTGITGGFHKNTGPFSQLSKYRPNLSFYRKYSNYRRAYHACIGQRSNVIRSKIDFMIKIHSYY